MARCLAGVERFSEVRNIVHTLGAGGVVGYVDCETGTYCGGTTVYKSLCKGIGCWAFNKVKDGVKEKITANILICFGDRALWTV